MFDFIKRLLLKYRYIVASDFITGKDKRCTKKTNLYVGINNLNEYHVATLLKEAYNLIVSHKEIAKRIEELNNSSFSNKMITVNMFHYGDTYKKYKNLNSIIIGNNFNEGIHHAMEFDYIDTIVVDGKIVIKPQN